TLTEIKNNNAKKVILRPKAEESQKTRFYEILRSPFGNTQDFLRSLTLPQDDTYLVPEFRGHHT
ncbi:MAG: hypothetical protein U9Q08_00485, partial [Candidatus Omnitrophota bacterium]|nr:hypothetical protein [Candidatus Omnitrophota bacterium]